VVAENEQDKTPSDVPAPGSIRFVNFVPVAPGVDGLSFRRFLEEKIPNYECPACRSKSYSVMQFFDPNVPSILVISTMNINPNNVNSFYTCYGITCNNCGNIQMFQQPAVENWARERLNLPRRTHKWAVQRRSRTFFRYQHLQRRDNQSVLTEGTVVPILQT